MGALAENMNERLFPAFHFNSFLFAYRLTKNYFRFNLGYAQHFFFAVLYPHYLLHPFKNGIWH